jgi:hypothetical protein
MEEFTRAAEEAKAIPKSGGYFLDDFANDPSSLLYLTDRALPIRAHRGLVHSSEETLCNARYLSETGPSSSRSSFSPSISRVRARSWPFFR